MRWLTIAATATFFVHFSATAQATTIIGVTTPHTIIVAADSRAIFRVPGQPPKPPVDTACKLAIVGNAVFGVSGVADSAAPPFYPRPAISTILKQRGPLRTSADTIVEQLEDPLLGFLRSLRNSDPADFEAKKKKSLVLEVLIAARENHGSASRLVATHVRFHITEGVPGQISITPKIEMLTSDDADPWWITVLGVRAAPIGPQAPGESPQLYAARLVKAQANHSDASGGEVDVVVLDRNGLRWAAKKPHCPDRE